MLNYDIPTSADLREVEQVLVPRIESASPIFKAFPDESTEETVLMWEQEDDYVGLQQVRGLGARPPRVQNVGFKRYVQEPGAYGEMMLLDEVELTRRRRMASFGVPMTIADMVARRQKQLLVRRVNRKEKMLWDLALYGYFAVMDASGTIIHTDGFTPQTYTAAISWSDHANSTPLADLRALQLLSRGQSVDFGPSAEVEINRTWANHLMANTNLNDLGGKRLTGLTPANSLNAINTILAGEGLPQVQVYDEGYKDESKTFQLFIPNARGLLIGRRQSGAKIGGFRYTLNVNNPDASPRPYMRVFDRSTEQVPAEIEVHDGFNGGPVIYFPGSLVSLNL